MLFPSGAIHTPKVLLASSASSHGIIILPALLCSMLSCPISSCSLLYYHSLLTHLKSIRYQKHLSGTSSPPVVQSSPCHVDNDCCIFLLTWSTLLLGSFMIRFMLSTNASPSNSIESLDMAHMICATKPLALIILSSGVLTAAHIWGPAPFPWPIPTAGSIQLSCPWDISESPYAVRTWCLKVASVLIMIFTTECGAPNWRH